MNDWQNSVLTGDCLEVLPELPAGSVHACITDPPYGLAFMGRDWDDFDPQEYQEWSEGWAREVKRVLKPGGHLLAFSGNRTHHRLFSGVQDAGFEIRDTITYHYGNGFPKGSDIGKTIEDRRDDREQRAEGHDDQTTATNTDPGRVSEPVAPGSNAIQKWGGWETSLKPATEFVAVARKPFDGLTVDCVLKHGTGALNIDETRIEYESEADRGTTEAKNPGRDDLETSTVYGEGRPQQQVAAEGRHPANVVFGESEAERLDREIGETSPGGGNSRSGDETASERYEATGGTTFSAQPGQRRGDSGGPSRYFYTSRATSAERTLSGRIDNDHPTVKPEDLMEWLVTLVTAEDQIVLDPFAGSGTTCMAAKNKTRRFIGIELNPEYADIARARIGLTPDDPARVREDAAQQGLEAFTEPGGEPDD